MRKRAGSFFKNVLTKGKGLFNNKKEGEEEAKDGQLDNDFDSEEDHDIIEVGKKNAGPVQMPANSLITTNHGSGGHSMSSANGGGSSNTNQGHEKPMTSMGSTKHLLIEFASNTFQAADSLIHGT
jgi:hypothetical protein